MKKEVKIIRVRWKARKKLFCSTCMILMILSISILYDSWFAKYTEIDRWIMSSMLSILIIGSILFFITNCIIWIKAKKTIYYINLQSKIVSKKGYKKIKYCIVYQRKENILQKVFGLVTLEFFNNDECLILKDVSKELIKYIDTVKLSN